MFCRHLSILFLFILFTAVFTDSSNDQMPFQKYQYRTQRVLDKYVDNCVQQQSDGTTYIYRDNKCNHPFSLHLSIQKLTPSNSSNLGNAEKVVFQTVSNLYDGNGTVHYKFGNCVLNLTVAPPPADTFNYTMYNNDSKAESKNGSAPTSRIKIYLSEDKMEVYLVDRNTLMSEITCKPFELFIPSSSALLMFEQEVRGNFNNNEALTDKDSNYMIFTVTGNETTLESTGIYTDVEAAAETLAETTLESIFETVNSTARDEDFDRWSWVIVTAVMLGILVLILASVLAYVFWNCFKKDKQFEQEQRDQQRMDKINKASLEEGNDALTKSAFEVLNSKMSRPVQSSEMTSDHNLGAFQSSAPYVSVHPRASETTTLDIFDEDSIFDEKCRSPVTPLKKKRPEMLMYA